MDECLDTIKELLHSTDIVDNYNYIDINNFSITIRTNKNKTVGEVSYSDFCDRWIGKFSTATRTNWVVRYSYPNLEKYEYKKIYKCQHTGFNKVKINKRSENRVRNRNCNASISFLIKKINKNTIKNDHLLKAGLNTIIKIDSKHSHQVIAAETFSYLRLTQETKERFWTYFNEGITPSCAKAYHEFLLEQQHDEGKGSFQEVLSNMQINPTVRQIYTIHDQWRKANFSGRDNLTMITDLKEKIKSYEDLGIKVIVNEDPLIVVILTPIMLRAHERPFTKEMIFIDSSDQINSYITFVFTAHKIGAIPLACILHTEQSEENYTLAFSLLKKSLGNAGFGGNGFPAIIITDDSNAQRGALRAVFPNSEVLLCSFHLCLAFWRWLCKGDHKIEEVDRPVIMRAFLSILYTETVEGFEDEYRAVIKNDLMNKYENLKKYILDLYIRKNEWALVFRTNLITRGINTYNINNSCEASIRIFKDVVLQMRKPNACAILDFVCKVCENYHKKRLLSYANHRRNKNELIYSKLKCKAKNLLVKKMSETHYLVTSEREVNLLHNVHVHMNLGMCDCISGQSAKFCKHICAVEEHFHFISSINIPKLSPDDRKDLARIAVGDDIDETFFENMMEISMTVDEMPNHNYDYNNLHHEETEIKSDSMYFEESEAAQSVDTNREIATTKLTNNFLNIVEIMKNETTSETTNMMIRLNETFETIKTPAAVMELFERLTSGSRRVPAESTCENVFRKRKSARLLKDAVSFNRKNAKSQ